MPVPDNESIAINFLGKVIIVADGKLVRHERAWCYRESVRNWARDGGRPSGAGLQEQAPNHISASSQMVVNISWTALGSKFTL